MASSSDVMSTAAVPGSPKLLEEVDVEDEPIAKRPKVEDKQKKHEAKPECTCPCKQCKRRRDLNGHWPGRQVVRMGFLCEHGG